MGEVIFKKTVVKKNDFYTWFKKTLEQNGWRNISSSPSDFDVFYSRGLSGDEELYFQTKEYYNSNTTQAISNSAYSFMGVRPFYKYSPSTVVGGKGTFEPDANASWSHCRLTTGSDYQNLPLDVYYHCDADKITMVIESPEFLNYGAQHIFIGKPIMNALVGKGTSTIFVSNYNSGRSDVTISMLEQGSLTVSPTLPLTYMPNISMNIDNIRLMATEIGFTNALDGVVGTVDGVLLISNYNKTYQIRSDNESFRGHVYTMSNGKKYRTTRLMNSSAQYFSIFMLFRIA